MEKTMSMCLGIATMTGAMSTVVKSNTAIPCRHTETFTTHVDYGSCVSIDIYEGETVVVKENNFLGTFVLRGIPPLRAGIPKIEVTFDLDANGILHVIAMDQGVGHSRDITIRNDEGNLSREDGFGSGTIQKGRRKTKGPGGGEERIGVTGGKLHFPIEECGELMRRQITDHISRNCDSRIRRLFAVVGLQPFGTKRRVRSETSRVGREM
jgi:hypothetical protein